MTLNEILQSIHALREDLLMFERKYGVPSELFYEAYRQGEEPAATDWVLDWSQWSGSYESLQELLDIYQDTVNKMIADKTVTDFTQLVERTARHESVAVAA